MFEPTHYGNGEFQRSIESIDQETADRRIERGIVGADDDFLLAIAVHIADDWRRREKRIEVLRPAGMINQFSSIPIAKSDLIGVVEAEHVDVVIVIGIYGNEARAVEPAEVVGDIDVRQPSPPQNCAIVIENRFVRLPL